MQTDQMQAQLDAALGQMGRERTAYRVVDLASLAADDSRRGYPTPTILYRGARSLWDAHPGAAIPGPDVTLLPGRSSVRRRDCRETQSRMAPRSLNDTQACSRAPALRHQNDWSRPLRLAPQPLNLCAQFSLLTTLHACWVPQTPTPREPENIPTIQLPRTSTRQRPSSLLWSRESDLRTQPWSLWSKPTNRILSALDVRCGASVSTCRIEMLDPTSRRMANRPQLRCQVCARRSAVPVQ